MRLNLIFHNVVKKESELNNKYTVTYDYYSRLVEKVASLISQRKTFYAEIQIYFDDGYASFNELVYPHIKGNYSSFTLSIVPDDLDHNGFLPSSLLKDYYRQGIQIASHSASHAALAVYKQGVLQGTPLAGEYKNSPKGQNDSLTENEVSYQYQSSKQYLENLLGKPVTEFVFPYGLYNPQAVLINNRYSYFKYLSTCDEYLDGGQLLRPRYLIDHERSVDETVNSILALRPLSLPK